MALSQNTLKKIKISSRTHLFPSKGVNAMLKSILVTTANGKPQTASSRLKFAVNVMLKVPIIPAQGHQNKGKSSFTGSGLFVLISQCRNNNALALQHGGFCTT